jgi:hypothetical protein
LLYGCYDVENRGKVRSKQGESAKVTGSNPDTYKFSSGRYQYQQRPLLILAPRGNIVSSGRCVPISKMDASLSLDD